MIQFNIYIWASLVAQRLKCLPCNAGDLGSIPGSGRSPGEGNGNPLQYSCLENPMDRGAWWATVHGVAKSRTQLSDFIFYLYSFPDGSVVKNLPGMQGTWVQSLGWKDPLEKEMATHSSILAWWIPWTEEPGGLQSTGLQRVGHDWATSLHFTLGNLSTLLARTIFSMWMPPSSLNFRGINF